MSLRALIVLCSLLASVSAANFTWRFISPANPEPPSRWYAGMVHYQGNLYVFGGIGINGQILDDLQQFDITTLRWSQIPATGPAARYGFVSGLGELDGEDVWVISHGRGSGGDIFSDTWALRLSDSTWFRVDNITGEPRSRFNAAGGAYPGSNLLWLSMGWGNGDRRLSDTWILNLTALEWVEVNAGGGLNQYNPFIPHARSDHAGTPISKYSFAIFGGCAGGGQVGGPCPLEDSWVISLHGDRDWDQLPRCATPRTGASMIWFPGRPDMAILWGGDDEDGPGVFPQRIAGPDYRGTEVTLLNNTAGEEDWTRYAALVEGPIASPARREGASFAAAATTGFIYLFGGRSIAGNRTILNELWMLEGVPEDSNDIGCPGITFSFVHLHGALMFAAWGLLLPFGALLGRYYRWTWPCWFIFHVICQAGGVLLTIAGFVIIFLVGSYDQPNFPHGIIGIVLTAILLQQFLNGIFHPCVDKEDGRTLPEEKSGWRKCWEVYHGISGFIAVAIGIGQVTLGALLVVAPFPVWVAWCSLGALWIIVFVLHEIIYLCCKVIKRHKSA